MDERFRSDRRIDEQPVTVSRGLRLVIITLASVMPVLFCILLKPSAAQAAWTTFAHMMQIEPRSGAAKTFDIASANLATLRPQEQAQFLMSAALNQSSNATEQILSRADSWRGRLKATPELSSLLDRALNSTDLRVRAAAIETELAQNNLAKNPRAVNGVMTRVKNEPAVRPWGLWVLGALGNRGVEPDRVLPTLVAYTHDPDQKTRYWAVEGLSVLGSDGSIRPLLGVFRTDPSVTIRDRAACALAQSGMLTKSQRLTAVPFLIDDAGDSSLDAVTQGLAYHALRDITGENLESNPEAWRSWWAENGGRRTTDAPDAGSVERAN